MTRVQDYADVVIGGMGFRLADGQDWFQRTGLSPMERDWPSLFPGRQNVSGQPGIQNVRDDDLRWLLTSFALGEGLAVIDPSQAEHFRRFDRSVGVDLSNPGEIRLARELFQFSNNAAPQSSTTHEASTFTDDIGTSTTLGTDRRLNNLGDAIRKDISLSTGAYRIDVYAYSTAESASVILGSSLNELNPPTAVAGTAMHLKNAGAKVGTGAQSPPVGVSTQVRFHVRLVSVRGARAVFTVLVHDATDDVTTASSEFRVGAPDDDGSSTKTKVCSLVFTPKAGHDYRYRLKLDVLEGDVGDRKFYLDEISTLTMSPEEMTLEALSGTTVLASDKVDLSTVETSAKISAVTVDLAAAATVRVRAVRSKGALPVFLDRIVVTPVSVGSPIGMELGQGNRIWMIDDARLPWYWDPVNSRWAAASVDGTWPSTGTVQSMAHTDTYEFAVFRQGTNWRLMRFGLGITGTEVLSGIGPTAVWVAAGANRLFVIFAASSGTDLYEKGLTDASAFTLKYAVGNSGIVVDTTIFQLMAGKKNGVVWFSNNGPDCWIYEWNGTSGAPLTNLPTGFVGRAILVGGSETWVGGGFPATDSTGHTTIRPAIFLIEGDRSSSQVGVEQLDVKLWRDEDPSTHIQQMQLYGTDLFVIAQVDSTPRKMRLWRISLAGTPAPFLEQEVTIPDDQAQGHATGMAVTWRDRFMGWSIGGPYRVSESYRTSGDTYLRSARYNFGLLETKVLLSIDVDGVFPPGTSAEVYYSLDGGPFAGAGSWNAPERRVISVPGLTRFFHNLQLEARLHTTDPAQTPVVYSISPAGHLPEYDRRWDLLLVCADEGSVWRKDGSQVPGSVGIDFLYDLAASGQVVEFEDLYHSARPEDARVYSAIVQSPRTMYVRRGEGLVAVRISERGLVAR